MNFFKNLFQPRVLRLFDQALRSHDYPRALTLITSGRIPAHRITETRNRQMIYNAVTNAAPTDRLMQHLANIADTLQSQTAVDALQEPDRTSVYLALITVALHNRSIDAARDLVGRIRSKEGRAQGLRKIAAHLACMAYNEQRIIDIFTSLPQPAYVAEELRNFFLSRILCKDFDGARRILLKIPQTIRRGLEPQLAFVERNHVDIQRARQRARELVHPDDIALTMALTAGVNDDIGLMAQYTRDLSPQLGHGAHATYATSLAYAGKVSSAIALLENIDDHMQEYLLRLGYLAFAFPLSPHQMALISKIFSRSEPYEASLAFWYHRFLENLVDGRCGQIEALLTRLENPRLRSALAGLLADFIAGV